MNERWQNIAVGATTLVAIVALAFLMLAFGWLPDFVNRGYTVTVQLVDAAGLHEGGIVTYRGIEVGKVTSVKLADHPQPGVVVTLAIKQNVQLPANVRAVLEGSVFGTNANLALLADPWPETDGELQHVTTDGSAVIPGSSASAIESFASLSDQLGTLSEEWVRVGQNLNALLEPRDPASVDSGDMLGNAATVMARFDQRLAQIETVLAGIDRYVNDAALWDDLHTTAANARDLSGKLNTQLPQQITDVRNSVIALTDDLSKSIALLNESLDAARKPDGTLGKLLVDPSLYDNLNDTVQRLNTAIDEVRLLVEKWKDEGLPIQF